MPSLRALLVVLAACGTKPAPAPDQNSDRQPVEEPGRGGLSGSGRNAYEVESVTLDTKEIRARQDRDAADVERILGIPVEHAATLLRFFKWNKEKLIERYMDAPEAVLQKAGVITDNSQAPQVVPAPAGFTCAICYRLHTAMIEITTTVKYASLKTEANCFLSERFTYQCSFFCFIAFVRRDIFLARISCC